MFEFYKNIATIIFGPLVDRTIKHFESQRMLLIQAGMSITLKVWISIIFFTVTLAYVVSFLTILALNVIFLWEFFFFAYMIIFGPILAAAFCFIFLYIYPIEKVKAIEKSIEINLPFALAHMSAIAQSGIPPEFMFEMLIQFREYGAISDQAKFIVRDITTLGMPSVVAINNVAKRCPSKSFKQILQGISSTIEKGGNLVEYLRVMSEKALFEYRLKREMYIKTLSTYADIYTGLLVAAPLMLLSTLGVMGIVGGNILGISIPDLIFLVTWLGLPFLNIAFLAFIHITHPGL
jgi:flagellar protein FlaJ